MKRFPLFFSDAERQQLAIWQNGPWPLDLGWETTPKTAAKANPPAQMGAERQRRNQK